MPMIRNLRRLSILNGVCLILGLLLMIGVHPQQVSAQNEPWTYAYVDYDADTELTAIYSISPTQEAAELSYLFAGPNNALPIRHSYRIGLVGEFKIRQPELQNEKFVFEHGLDEPSIELHASS